MPKQLVAILTGVYAAFQDFFGDLLGNAYVDATIKGLIGGVAGYLGTLLMTWMIKRMNSTAQHKNNQNQNNLKNQK